MSLEHIRIGAVMIRPRRPYHAMPTWETYQLTETGRIVDHIAVERVANGEPHPLNPDEKRLAGEILLRRGAVDHIEISRRVGVAPRTIERWADALRKGATA